jgi:hypothetical protein
MPGQELQTLDPHRLLERVITMGDLSQLTPEERNAYYTSVCDSLGLNALTRPLEYLPLPAPGGGKKLVLYARKDATDQLRKIYNVSIQVKTERDGDIFRAKAMASFPDGRKDEDIGSVWVKGLSGDFLSNAEMKAVTKSKRRVTLSICGLGFLDESEIESISEPVTDEQKRRLEDLATELRARGVTDKELRAAMIAEVNVNQRSALTQEQADKVIAAFADWTREFADDKVERSE